MLILLKASVRPSWAITSCSFWSPYPKPFLAWVPSKVHCGGWRELWTWIRTLQWLLHQPGQEQSTVLRNKLIWVPKSTLYWWWYKEHQVPDRLELQPVEQEPVLHLLPRHFQGRLHQLPWGWGWWTRGHLWLRINWVLRHGRMTICHWSCRWECVWHLQWRPCYSFLRTPIDCSNPVCSYLFMTADNMTCLKSGLTACWCG